MSVYFLSYSRSDQVIALRLADDLIAAGVSLWVDQYDIRPSQHWDREVEAAVHACRGLIVLLSPRSAESANVADEVSVAIERRKIVIPVLIEACTVPLRMTRMQFIDATSDYPGALRRCLTEIGRHAATAGGGSPVPLHPPPGAGPATQPIGSVTTLPAAAIEVATRRLTAIIGPIAGRVVATAAVRADSVASLYALLAERIADPVARAGFVSATPAAPPVPGASVAATAAADPPVDASPEEVNRITAALTIHLGPVARRVVEREHRAASSLADLCQRLAQLIPGERHRAIFLAQTVSAGAAPPDDQPDCGFSSRPPCAGRR